MFMALPLPQVRPDENQIQSAQDLMSLGDQFLSSHDVKPISRQGYRARLKQFFLWIADNKIQRPTRQDILAYKRFLISSKFTAATISGYLVSVRRLFSFLEAEGIYFDVAKTIKGPAKQKGFRRDALSVKKAVELLRSIDQSTLVGMRDFCMILLLLKRGLRTIELSRLDVEDIRQHGNETVLWIQGKGRDEKDEFVVMGNGLANSIRQYLTMRGTTKPNEPLFGTLSTNCMGQRMSTRSIRRIVKQKLRSIKLDTPRYSSHSLRHSCVTFALMNGSSLIETAAMVRHTDINSTLIYNHAINRTAGIPERAVDDLLEKEQESA
jgi:site-specific recombinase XerD